MHRDSKPILAFPLSTHREVVSRILERTTVSPQDVQYCTCDPGHADRPCTPALVGLPCSPIADGSSLAQSRLQNTSKAPRKVYLQNEPRCMPAENVVEKKGAHWGGGKGDKRQRRGPLEKLGQRLDTKPASQEPACTVASRLPRAPSPGQGARRRSTEKVLFAIYELQPHGSAKQLDWATEVDLAPGIRQIDHCSARRPFGPGSCAPPISVVMLHADHGHLPKTPARPLSPVAESPVLRGSLVPFVLSLQTSHSVWQARLGANSLHDAACLSE